MAALDHPLSDDQASAFLLRMWEIRTFEEGHPAMPRLSDTMEEGTIIEWLAGEGETVAAGDDLLEVRTDKAAATYAAEEAGVLRIREPAGRTVPVGTVIAELA